MSYAYRIKLDRKTSQVQQSGEWMISLLELLAPGEMNELLADSFLALGWHKDGEEIFLEIEGVRCTLDISGQKITTSLSDEVSVEHTVIADSDDTGELRRARIEQGEREQERALDRATELKNQELTAKLMSLESTILEQINRASHITHSTALKLKAERLGELISVQENADANGALEITIHVKVK